MHATSVQRWRSPDVVLARVGRQVKQRVKAAITSELVGSEGRHVTRASIDCLSNLEREGDALYWQARAGVIGMSIGCVARRQRQRLPRLVMRFQKLQKARGPFVILFPLDFSGTKEQYEYV